MVLASATVVLSALLVLVWEDCPQAVSVIAIASANMSVIFFFFIIKTPFVSLIFMRLTVFVTD